jgi:hypothetical protein
MVHTVASTASVQVKADNDYVKAFIALQFLQDPIFLPKLASIYDTICREQCE